MKKISVIAFAAGFMSVGCSGNTYSARSATGGPAAKPQTSSPVAQSQKQQDENQNSCRLLLPPIGEIKPKELWRYKPSSGSVLAINLMSGDIDNNGDTEILALEYVTNVNIIALHGKTGRLLWRISDLANPRLALADLDGDKKSEIITLDTPLEQSHTRVSVYDTSTRSILWRSEFKSCTPGSNSCFTSPTVADINGDGTPEIITMSEVHSAKGELLFNLIGSSGGAQGHIHAAPIVADVDPREAGLEIITRKDVFSATGTKLTSDSSQRNLRYLAVVDLDRNGTNEIIALEDSELRVLSGLDKVVWKHKLPSTANAVLLRSDVIVADFDGDGFLDISVRGSAEENFSIVLSHVGKVLSEIRAPLSRGLEPGLLAFDLNGDGEAEIIENAGAAGVTVRSGKNDQVLLSNDFNQTDDINPIVVNVDDTPSAEIVTASGDGGVIVTHDPSELWQGARRVWNQYNYIPELISDAMQIVRNPGSIRTGFRVNPAIERAPICK